MTSHELLPGRKVRIVAKPWGDQGPQVLVIEQFPVRGLYNDYVMCRWGDRPLYFLPDELRPLEEGSR